MKKFLAPILLWLGCKDLSLSLYGLKHFNFKLFFDGIFFGKYRFQPKSGITIELAEKYEGYIGNEKYKKSLVKGLDRESLNTVNQLEKNIKWVLNQDKPFIRKSDFGIKENDNKIKKYINKYTKDIFLPIDHKEQTVFYYKHGINFVDNLKVILRNKDIIDCGAFIGDSAMMFTKELGFVDVGGGILDKIYCLEPEKNNRELLLATIKQNKMEGKIVPIPLGVGKNKENLFINPNGCTSKIGDKNNESNVIAIDTIDHIVKDYGINPGMIKRDIEGLEYASILGAEETIKKYKPILLVSIYHNGRDFYEIKPLIESWKLGYKFKIRHLSTHLFFETMLICY